MPPDPQRAEAPDTGLLAALRECIAEQGLKVEAVIAGAGFKVRREDMKKLLTATRGKVFTLQNMDRMIEWARAGDFKTRPAT